MIALDTETHLIEKGRLAPPLVCVQIGNGGAAEIYHRTDDWRGVARGVLDHGMVGHNVAYDVGVMLEADPALWPAVVEAYDNDRVTDTMLRQRLIDIAQEPTPKGRKYSLDATCQRWWWNALDKGADSWRLRYHELHDVPIAQWPHAATHYALEDAKATWFTWQGQEGAHPDYLKDQYRQARAALALHFVSAWGICTDGSAIERLERSLASKREELGARLLAAGLIYTDKDGWHKDTKKCAAMLENALGADTPRTDKGAVSLAREGLLSSGVPLLEDYALFAQLGSAVSKDLPALRRGSPGPLHTRFNSLVDTGRTSSGDADSGMGGNIQNLPRRRCPCDREPHEAWCCGYHVRECFVPRPGNAFVACDYGGLELCTLAQVCKRMLGRSTLADALNDGLDPHLVMASQITGRDYVWCKEHKKDHDVFLARQTGKVANFGLPGGLGARTLVHYAKQSYDVTLTEAQAQQLKDRWMTTYPEMRNYFDMVNQQVNGPGVIKHLFSDRLRGGMSYTSACNSYFQGLGADVAKAALWEVVKWLYSMGDGRAVNFVHDEIVVECPIDRVTDVANRCRDIMIKVAATWLPDVKIDVSRSAMLRYQKTDGAWDGDRLRVHP